MSGVDDPSNFTGNIGPGESPPVCFNLVDSDGFYWFSGDGDHTGRDFQIFYQGDPVDNPIFITLKVVGTTARTDISASIESIGSGSADLHFTDFIDGVAHSQVDFGLPVDHFSFSSGFTADDPPVELGYKFSLTDPGGEDGGVEVVIPTDFVLFPECPGYGFAVQPQYLVKLNAREGGFENVKRRWPRPINVYTAVPIGDRDEAQIQSILNFWHAMGGRATPFLIKDWADFKSCRVQEDISVVDQPLETVTLLDSSTAYQLTKIYTVGPLTQVREITQPKADTIIVANAAGDVQTDFTLDESSGLLKPGGSFVGAPTSWGGEFYVPVRFDSELDMEVVDKQIQSVTFTLREKRIKLANTFPGPP